MCVCVCIYTCAVLTAENIKIVVFWYVTPCSLDSSIKKTSKNTEEGHSFLRNIDSFPTTLVAAHCIYGTKNGLDSVFVPLPENSLPSQQKL